MDPTGYIVDGVLSVCDQLGREGLSSGCKAFSVDPSRLAGAYERGQFGLPQNHAEAAKWYRKAAEQNDHRAQLNLGVYLAEGKGVERKVVEGLMWVLLANYGFEKGYLFRDAAHQWVNRLEAQMSEQQIAEARTRKDSSPYYKEYADY